MVGEMNEMYRWLKEMKMKHDQWSADSRKWDETWTIKCGLKELRWNMNNEVDNVTFNNCEKYLVLLAGKIFVELHFFIFIRKHSQELTPYFFQNYAALFS